MMISEFLQPVLVLVGWTFVMWFWMYATRIPAMKTTGIAPDEAQSPAGGWKERMPRRANWVSENYNHLHEQPVLFYTLMLASAVVGQMTSAMHFMAWAYVVVRICHSLVQATINHVMLRFVLFVLGSIILMILFVLACPGFF